MNRREILLAAAATAVPPFLSSRSDDARAAAAGSAPEDFSALSLADASRAIRGRTVSSHGLTLACLQRIDDQNPQINALISVMREEALAQASRLDAEAAQGKFRSPLHGIPIALKDAIDTAGTRTTAASEQFENRIPSEDADVVRRLRQDGAVIIAKANLAEFSLSPSGASSHFGPVRNPWSLERVTGGSSSGSAAATATHMCFGALGTDSGGSVRIPAAWCGLVGLKPTDGLVSTSGIIPSVASLDSCGPMARRVEDVALLFSQMVGYDALDIRSVVRPKEDYEVSLRQPVSQLRVGVARRPFFDDLDPQIAKSVEEAIALIAKLTHGIKDVTISNYIALHDVLINAAEVTGYHRTMLEQHPDKYTPTTRKILEWCRDFVDDKSQGSPSAKLARYIEARAALERRRRTIDAAFDGFDVLAMPTLKSLPPPIERALQAERSSTEDALFSIENTMIFNILGLPALTVPCGFSSEGLPIGLMICGPRFSEGRLLALAAAYERSTQWHERTPPLKQRRREA
jgi:aspartyl-tRNA(Asn)/glutamyl-tRNA(Gln) amidotransferase subunit A